MRIMILVLLSFLSLIAQARATSNAGTENPAASVVTGDFTLMKATGSARVETVIDGETILMTDGKIVRLLGVSYPFIAAEGMEDGGNIGAAAKLTLQKLLPKGTEVQLYQSRNVQSGRTDRMGHTLAHLVTKKDGQWINGLLLATGLAYTMTSASNPDMADQMYALEQAARDKGLLLWSPESPYGVLTPETAAGTDGQFRIVEGTVNRAATAKNNLYLNFGDDWKKDFTVMISPEMRRLFSRRGIDAMALTGRKIRVRGWIREWNGPYMELETPERLEAVRQNP